MIAFLPTWSFMAQVVCQREMFPSYGNRSKVITTEYSNQILLRESREYLSSTMQNLRVSTILYSARRIASYASCDSRSRPKRSSLRAAFPVTTLSIWRRKAFDHARLDGGQIEVERSLDNGKVDVEIIDK